MLMTLSHCVVVRLADGVSGDGSTDGVSGGGSTLAAKMLCASIRAFFVPREPVFFLAIALPAATRFGFFCYVAGVCEVTCCSTCCCESAIYFTE